MSHDPANGHLVCDAEGCGRQFVAIQLEAPPPAEVVRARARERGWETGLERLARDEYGRFQGPGDRCPKHDDRSSVDD